MKDLGLNGGVMQGSESEVRVPKARTWQDILDARGYVIIVATDSSQRIEIGIPIPFAATSSFLGGDLPPGSIVPIMKTTFADFLEQANMYPGCQIWCGELDRYFRCVAE